MKFIEVGNVLLNLELITHLERNAKNWTLRLASGESLKLKEDDGNTLWEKLPRANNESPSPAPKGKKHKSGVE
jgi:hypothetical protein